MHLSSNLFIYEAESYGPLCGDLQVFVAKLLLEWVINVFYCIYGKLRLYAVFGVRLMFPLFYVAIIICCEALYLGGVEWMVRLATHELVLRQSRAKHFFGICFLIRRQF